MTRTEFESRFPNMAMIGSPSWWNQNHDWFEPVVEERLAWYQRIDQHLGTLRGIVGDHAVIECYRAALCDRNQLWQTLYELEAAVLLGGIGTNLKLHVPRGDGSDKNFDIQVRLQGVTINADSKTRRDNFPFNYPQDAGGIHSGVRATLDPHDASALNLPFSLDPAEANSQPTPESTTIRQRLLEGLAQLPQQGFNIIVLGLIYGHVIDLEEALYGTEMLGSNRNIANPNAPIERFRVRNGAFCDGEPSEPFCSLGAVI